MDFDLRFDLNSLRWGKAGYFEHSKRNIINNLRSSGLEGKQVETVIDKGREVEKGIRSRYDSDLWSILKNRFTVLSYEDQVFGSIEEGTAPKRGEVLREVANSYLTVDDIQELDILIDHYEDPNSSFGLCYSSKKERESEIEENSELLIQNHIQDFGSSLSRKSLGDGVSYFMLMSEPEAQGNGVSNCTEEASENARKILSTGEDFTYWLLSPMSLKTMLRSPVWYTDSSEEKSYIAKNIKRIENKLGYWDNFYLDGENNSKKVLENLGKFCCENPNKDYEFEVLTDLTKIFPESGGDIAEEIYENLSNKNISEREFEKRSEDIVLKYRG